MSSKDNFLKARDSFQGTATVEGSRVILNFTFHPKRIEAIKKIPQFRFHKESKAWSIPVAHLEELKRNRYFNEQSIEYSNSSGSSVRIDDPATIAARSELEKNPFEVPLETLKRAQVEIAFTRSEKGAYIVCNLAVQSSKKRKSFLDGLTAMSGVHYLKSEGAYFIPTSSMIDLLKRLRNERYFFGVEESLGKQLRETAEERASLLANEVPGDAHSFRRCFLVPFVTEENPDAEEYYSLNGYTIDQLRLLIPSGRDYRERKLKAQNLSSDGLLECVYNAKRVGIRLFFTAQTEWKLKMLRAQLQRSIDNGAGALEESILAEAHVDASWIRSSDGDCGFLFEREFYLQNAPTWKRNPFARKSSELLPEFPEKIFFRFPRAQLLQGYQRINEQLKEAGIVPRESSGFAALFEEIQIQNTHREKVQALRIQTDAELDSSGLEYPEIVSKLFPHQRVGVSFLLENTAALLGDDMGLGKTLSVLTAYEILRARGEVDFLLVICPNSLTRNWHRETTQWFPHRRLALLGNDKAEKVAVLKRIEWEAVQFDGLVVNYESARLDYVSERLHKIISSKRVLLCLDESQRVKNPQSKTFEALSSVSAGATRRILLSGTPTPRDLGDIWAQMFLLDRGERLGTNYYRWLESVAVLGNSFSDFAVQSYKPEGIEETISRVQEVLLRRKKEEVINLPAKTFSVRDVPLIGDQLKRFNEIRKELMLRISSTSGQTFTREISSILEEYLRAVQSASNPRIIDENWKGEPAKFLELDAIVDEVVRERGEKIVIWTNYLVNIRELVTRYNDLGARPYSGEVSVAEREQTVREFQTGLDVKVLVAIPAAGGVGITLTAAQTAVYVDKTWNAEQYLQSIDRIHRIGQQGTVNIIGLHSSKVDWLIWRNLKTKEEAQRKLLGDNQSSEESPFSNTSDRSDLQPTRSELLEALASE